jgi:tetratricopeptide (TPR) repeat protein
MNIRLALSTLLLAAATLAGGCGGAEKLDQHIAKGKALLAEGKYEAAATALKAAAEQDKNSHEAWLNLGHAYRGMKKNEEALAAYVTAKRIDRHSILPHLAHAKVQIDLGRIALATQELNFVVEMDPRNVEALVLLGRISQQPHPQPDGTTGVSRSDLERAELNLDAAATLAPNDAAIREELAKVRELLGKK